MRRDAIRQALIHAMIFLFGALVVIMLLALLVGR
jgi:hypothetical protein